MARAVAFYLIAVSGILEGLLALIILVNPGLVGPLFKIALGPDVLRLAFFTAWLLWFLVMGCAVAAVQLRARLPGAWISVMGLGLCWLAAGIGLFFELGEAQYLFIDALRGAVLISLSRSIRASERRA